MADVVYTLKSVSKYAGAIAERSAVLWPLTGVRPDQEDRMNQAAQRVLAAWRQRCLDLHRAGYSKLQGLRLQYARNCPPAGVVMVPEGRRAKLQCCRQMAVCPWCWSRLVVKRTFDQVVATLATLGETHDPAAPGLAKYKLIVTSRPHKAEDGPTQPRALLDHLSLSLSRSKHQLKKVAAGYAMLAVAAPGKEGWVHSTRALVLIPRDYPTKPKNPEYTPLTKRAIARAVARFARYPRGMLAGDVRQTRRLLEARAHCRFLRFGGVFTKLHGRGAKGETGRPSRFLDL